MKKVKQKKIAFKSVPNPNNVNINNSHRDPKESLDIESMDEETQLPHATKTEGTSAYYLTFMQIEIWITLFSILFSWQITTISYFLQYLFKHIYVM